MSLYLGLDIGTQGTKGLLLDTEAGAVVARAARSYDLIEGLPPGFAEQHPDTWIDAVRDVARELVTADGVAPERLRGVSVSGQQHGLVVLDDADTVVRPAKLWCDTSTAGEARELSEAMGRHVPAGYTASKVLWLARHEPDAWERTRRVMLPHDYVNLRLTGGFVTEAGDASGTGYFDAERREYDAEALECTDPRLAARVPPLVAPGQPAGELSTDGAALLGLPGTAAGMVVGAGGGDNMMSAIGSGATRPGIAVCSLGTSGTVFTYAAEPVIDHEGAVAPFCDSTGGWLPLLCVLNATGVLEEVRAAFGADLDELTAAAAEVPAGCGGLLFVPYLVGERVPDLPDAAGLLAGVRPGSLRPGVLFRAALEGVALNLAWGVGRMRALGLAVDRVRLVGGGARNPLWRRILTDAFGAPVELLDEAESAAFGAAIQAAWTDLGSGSIDALAGSLVRTSGVPTEPSMEGVALYGDALQRLRQRVGRSF